MAGRITTSRSLGPACALVTGLEPTVWNLQQHDILHTSSNYTCDPSPHILTLQMFTRKEHCITNLSVRLLIFSESSTTGEGAAWCRPESFTFLVCFSSTLNGVDPACGATGNIGASPLTHGDCGVDGGVVLPDVPKEVTSDSESSRIPLLLEWLKVKIMA